MVLQTPPPSYTEVLNSASVPAGPQVTRLDQSVLPDNKPLLLLDQKLSNTEKSAPRPSTATAAATDNKASNPPATASQDTLVMLACKLLKTWTLVNLSTLLFSITRDILSKSDIGSAGKLLLYASFAILPQLFNIKPSRAQAGSSGRLFHWIADHLEAIAETLVYSALYACPVFTLVALLAYSNVGTTATLFFTLQKHLPAAPTIAAGLLVLWLARRRTVEKGSVSVVRVVAACSVALPLTPQ